MAFIKTIEQIEVQIANRDADLRFEPLNCISNTYRGQSSMLHPPLRFKTSLSLSLSLSLSESISHSLSLSLSFSVVHVGM